ncbi:MAG: deoxyguanosinetriphosphate triphosphohydrolase [Longibaculum sp.]
MEWKDLLTQERLNKNEIQEKEKSYLKDYMISQFEKDYQIVINSAAFRRLQDKTQVFPLDTSDFIRTRLTHSLETSFIAKKLGNMVLYNMSVKRGEASFQKREYDRNEEFLLKIPEILSCAGLLHDMGNPPFGHFGEVIIGEWFRENLPNIILNGKRIVDKENLDNSYLNDAQYADLSYFEGNAQLIRVVTKLYKNTHKRGMNLTKAVLGSLIKYPDNSLNIEKKYKKFGYFQADQEIFNAIVESTGQKNGDIAMRHPLVYLLEAADDIAYLTADVEDAIKKGVISFEVLKEFYACEVNNYLQQNNVEENQKKYVKSLADIILNSTESDDKDVVIKKWMNSTRDSLMNCAAYYFVENYEKIMSGQFDGDLFQNTFHEKTIDILKKLAIKFIFCDEKIMKLEISGSMIINSLLNKFVNAIIRYDMKDETMSKENQKLINLLPHYYIDIYYQEIKELGDDVTEGDKLYLRLLLVTDYISGMTDSYAKRLYFELNGLE